MSRGSAWADTRTFFPLFEQVLDANANVPLRVLIVGASDGKFVEPLLRRGHQIVAMDPDTESLAKLVARLGDVAQPGQLKVLAADILELDEVPEVDACWTSCSWHYSRNFRRPLKDFIDLMVSGLVDGGWFGAEYMMPVAVQHVRAEHYLEPGEIWRYIPGFANIWEAYTPTFIEDPHEGQPEHHVHRMGFVVARKLGN
jgi:Methyltransferase domain